MARMPRRRPSFFKVLMGNFTEKLRIPPAFVKNFKGVLSNKSILKTDTRRSCVVNIEQNGRDCFLEIGDFLVFWLVGDSTFEVVTYGRSGCPKNANSAIERQSNLSAQNRGNPFMDGTLATSLPGKMEIVGEGGVEPAGFAEPKHPYFIAIMKKHNKSRIAIPKKFGTETGMASKTNAVLKDPKGKQWRVKICERIMGRCRTINLTNGWPDFRKANKLEEGDECLFQFVRRRDTLIQVYIRRVGESGAIV